jgi:tetratricopeptide (TPR) repeat protein
MLRAIVPTLLILVQLSPLARADDERTVRAKARFEAGRALYSLGDYEAALREFAAGYQQVPRPQFLINLGQTYRKLERFDKAREMYEKFLAEASPDDPNRPAVAKILDELREEAARRKPEPPLPSPLTPTPTPTPPPAPPAPAPLVVAPAPSPPARHRFDKRQLGWIIPVAVVVAAGAAVGIYFAARPGDGCVAGLPCVDSTHRGP